MHKLFLQLKSSSCVEVTSISDISSATVHDSSFEHSQLFCPGHGKRCGRGFLWGLTSINHSSRRVGLWAAQCPHWALGSEWQRCSNSSFVAFQFKDPSSRTRTGAPGVGLKVGPLLRKHELSDFGHPHC